MQRPADYADAARGTRHVFIRDMVLPARIGVYASEQGATQRVRLNVSLAVGDPGGVGPDRLERVVDYGALAQRLRDEVAREHVQLIETLAERLAEICLADSRVVAARVRVEKLDILSDSDSAGVEVERLQPKVTHRALEALELQ